MVVAATVAPRLEARLAIVELYGTRQPALRQELERAVDCGYADPEVLFLD